MHTLTNLRKTSIAQFVSMFTITNNPHAAYIHRPSSSLDTNFQLKCIICTYLHIDLKNRRKKLIILSKNKNVWRSPPAMTYITILYTSLYLYIYLSILGLESLHSFLRVFSSTLNFGEISDLNLTLQTPWHQFTIVHYISIP